MTDNNSSEDNTIRANHHLSICALASGSKGNAIYISDGSTSLLIDAGLSGIEIQRRLESRGLSPADLDAILVSHEHTDHVNGVGILSRRFKLPVYVNQQTENAAHQLKKMFKVNHFECGTSFQLNNLTVHPFSISHDANDPAGFTIKNNGSKIGVATDLGIATSVVKEHLKHCSLLVLEANHDPVMLAEGPYPWPLKQRVKGRTGHLSNIETKTLLAEIKSNRLTHVVLAHLSEENNTPEKALAEVGQAIGDSQIELSVAMQNRGGRLIKLPSTTKK